MTFCTIGANVTGNMWPNTLTYVKGNAVLIRDLKFHQRQLAL